MSSIGVLSLSDNQTAPAQVPFDPILIDSAGVAKWQNRSGGISIGFLNVTGSLKAPTKGSKNYKAVYKLELPVLEQTSPSTASGIQPAPTRAYANFVTIEFVINERSDQGQRDYLYGLAKSLMAAAPLKDAVTKYERVY